MEVGAKMEFACHQCSKKFAHLRGLLRHKKGHGPPLYLHCQKCNYRDVRRDNIRRHYKRQHKDHLADLEEIKMSDQRRQEAGRRAEPGTRREARRLIVAKPRIPKTATIVEETLTRTYVDGVEIHRETRQRRYFQDVLIDCPLLLTK